MKQRIIFIKNWIVPALVGVFPREKVVPQRLRISITMTEAEARPAAQVEDVVNYATVKEQAAAILAAQHHDLLETLAERIASRMLEDKRLSAVTVKLEKLDIFEDCESCGVELRVTR